MTDYSCSYCSRSSSFMRIKCEICVDFYLCVECFSCGVESGQHQNNHSYSVPDDGFTSLFTSESDWSARKDILLLEGLELNGFGNWDLIAFHVDGKSAEEVQQHYERHFLSGSFAQTPLGIPRLSCGVVDHTGPLEGPLSPSLTASLPALELSGPEALELGFMPLRDDFEREWDNDAEQILSGALVQQGDDDIDIGYKLALASMYRVRLRERNRRKLVARQYNLAHLYHVSCKKGHPGAKKRTVREYKTFQDSMKKVAQFMTQSEHDRFFESLQREKHLKTRIKDLMRYRRNGVSTQEDALAFDEEMEQRQREKNHQKSHKRLVSCSLAVQKLSQSSKSVEETSKKAKVTGKRNNGARRHIDYSVAATPEMVIVPQSPAVEVDEELPLEHHSLRLRRNSVLEQYHAETPPDTPPLESRLRVRHASEHTQDHARHSIDDSKDVPHRENHCRLIKENLSKETTSRENHSREYVRRESHTRELNRETRSHEFRSHERSRKNSHSRDSAAVDCWQQEESLVEPLMQEQLSRQALTRDQLPDIQPRQMLCDNEIKLCKSIGMKTTSYLTLKTNIIKDYLRRQQGSPVKMRFPSGFDNTHRRTILTFLEHSGWLQAG